MINLFGGKIFDTIIKILLTLAIGGILIALLPSSPFADFVNTIGELPYLGYLNWFFPVGRCLSVLTVWGIAIGVYYGISWILRYLNIIGT